MKLQVQVLLIFMLLPSTAYAGPYSYECEVYGEYVYSTYGELTPEKKIYFGEKFNVERKSGVVLGGSVGNSSYPTKTVIDMGGKEQSYKLLWVSKEVDDTNGGKNAVYLSIEEFNENFLKPFTLVVGSTVLSGLCK